MSASGDAGGARAAIEAELLDWMTGPDRDREDDARFERLALALFAFQSQACAPYARLCESLGRHSSDVRSHREIPAVPTGAFKELALRCFPASATRRIFRTSGTTLERRGELHLDTLTLYEASLLASLRRCLLSDLVGRRIEMRFLAPGPEEAPDSSLTHMFECLRLHEGSARSGYDLVHGALRLDPLRDAIAGARERGEPLLVAGTSFAFVHLLDALAALDARGREAFRLPAGSLVMETGGFKGRSREVPRERLRRQIAEGFDLDARDVVNQYGMTELGSQFYDSTRIDREGPRRKLRPPWTRVRFLDPLTGRDVAPGEVGQIVIHDLANTGSVAAIQTADLGRAVLDAEGREIGFDVLGREADAEARGCSIAADTMLDAAGEGGSR
jgi:hypothetical protein